MSSEERGPKSARQRLFYALAEPTRRDIVELLATNGQMTATGIYDNFTVSHPAISQHLKVLREANVVQMEKHAQQHVYKLNTDAILDLGGWAKQIADLWNQRFDALDKVLEEEKKKEERKRVRK
jgi:DNA-binding transcriptional ArsR family regulator